MTISTMVRGAGFPAPDRLPRERDELQFQRAVTAYRFWYPTVSAEGVFYGNRELGLRENESLPLVAAAPHHVGFTLNSDMPYCSGALDLSSGPLIIEIPPGPYVGLVDDRHQRWIVDLGLAGPDGDRGGRYVLLPPGHGGATPSGYHVARSASRKVFFALRALPTGGDVATAIEQLGRVRIYPAATADSPRFLSFVDATVRPTDVTPLRWEDNLQYWEVLHAILDAEPVVDEFRPMYGLLASVGVEKGRRFAPTPRERRLLERAARAGRDAMLVAAFASERPDRVVWPDRQWEWTGLVTDNGDFERPTGLDLEARDRWFGQAVASSPAMFRRQTGAGSLYWLVARDRSGVYLDGGRRYTLRVPLPVPAGSFWSVTVYDAATRSQVSAAQGRAAFRSLVELKGQVNHGAIELHFGPDAPRGHEARWIQTVPGRGWFAYFRVYGPAPAAFDGTWRPGDLQRA